MASDLCTSRVARWTASESTCSGVLTGVANGAETNDTKSLALDIPSNPTFHVCLAEMKMVAVFAHSCKT